MTTYAVETVALTKSYKTKTVLAGVDLRVTAGQVFALLGPNGAGKTTLINILSTLSRPDGGQARVAAHDVVTEAAAVRRSISLTGQYAAVDEALSGRENLIMMCRLLGLDGAAARHRSDELLGQFELTTAADQRAGHYSGGMRRRLDLAVGLITVPAVIFLDEPTTGLDTRSRQALWRIIAGLSRAGSTVFLTTQYLEEADQLADRIAVIDNGTIVAEGTAGELKAAVGSDVVELRDQDDRMITEIGTDGTAAGLRRVLEDLSPDHRALRISVRRPSLDDVFLRLTGDRRPASEESTSGNKITIGDAA